MPVGTEPTFRIHDFVSSFTHEDQSFLQDDVIMSSVPSSDIPDNLWNDLKAFASGLRAKDPNTLAPGELILLQILQQRQYELEHKEMKTQNRHKRSGSLIDEVMMSPPPSHQSLPPQPASTPTDPVHSEDLCTEEDQDAEMVELTSAFTAFINVRLHPYRRAYARGQPLPGSIPKWREKTASPRKASSRKTYGEAQEGFTENEMRVQAKKQEIIAQARLHVIEAGGRWDEETFIREYGFRVQDHAERLVEAELAENSTNSNDEFFAQAAQYINDTFKQELLKLEESENVAHAKVQVVKDLEEAMAACRLELKQLRAKRKQYPTNFKELEDQFRQTAALRRAAAKRFQDLMSSLLSMEENGQDFREAWKILSAEFDLPDNPPFGMGTSTSTCFSSSSQSSPTCDSTTSSNDSGPDYQPFPPASTPDQQSSSSSSSSSGSQSRESRPFSYSYLPTARPLSRAERRLEFYEQVWGLLHSTETVLRDEHASFEQIPLPVLFDLQKDQLERLNDESIQEFIFHPVRMQNLAIQLGLPESTFNSTRVKRLSIQREITRWHPDRICRILPKFTLGDRQAIETVSLKVTQCLNNLKEL